MTVLSFIKLTELLIKSLVMIKLDNASMVSVNTSGHKLNLKCKSKVKELILFSVNSGQSQLIHSFSSLAFYFGFYPISRGLWGFKASGETLGSSLNS